MLWKLWNDYEYSTFAHACACARPRLSCRFRNPSNHSKAAIIRRFFLPATLPPPFHSGSFLVWQHRLEARHEVVVVRWPALIGTGWRAIAAAARADIGRDRHHVAMVIDEVAHLPDHAQAKPLHPVGLFVAEAFALERAAEAFMLPFHRSEEHTSALQSLMRNP